MAQKAISFGFSLLMGLMMSSTVLAAYAGNYRSPHADAIDINQTYLYGEYNSDKTKAHHGVDWLSYLAPVYAQAGGTVNSGTDSCYGKWVSIAIPYNGTTVYAFYAHLSQITKGSGTVVTGEQVGISGNTGTCANGLYHMHHEMRARVDSVCYTRNPEGFMARSTSDGYGGAYGKVTDKFGNWANAIKITGATKPESSYGSSYTYGPDTACGGNFGDLAAYGINYYIARANPGTVTLTYYGPNGNATKTVTIPQNGEVSVGQTTLP